MSVMRINEFQAREGQGNALHDLLRAFLPMIEAATGCLSCRLLQSDEDPTRVIVLEEWQSIEAHQSAIRNIPHLAIDTAMQYLAAPPKGAYYHA